MLEKIIKTMCTGTLLGVLSFGAVSDSYAEEVKPVKEEKSREEKIKDIKGIILNNQWGWGAVHDPAEDVSIKLANDYGDLAAEVCLEYLKKGGTLDQRKTIYTCLGKVKSNISHGADIILKHFCEVDDGYVLGLARGVIYRFDKETCLKHIENNSYQCRLAIIPSLSKYMDDPEVKKILKNIAVDKDEKEVVRVESLESLSACKDDPEVKKIFENIILNKNEDITVRLHALLYDSSREERAARLSKYIGDEKEPLEFRKALIYPGLAWYMHIEGYKRKHEDLPIEDYDLLRKTLIDLSDSDENYTLREKAKKYLTKPIDFHKSLTGELALLYFKRARLYLSRKDRANAKKDFHSAVSRVKDISDKEKNDEFNSIYERGLGVSGFNYPTDYPSEIYNSRDKVFSDERKEFYSIFEEIISEEKDPKVQQIAREAVDFKKKMEKKLEQEKQK